jgi:glycosyltransferase 2 family protein
MSATKWLRIMVSVLLLAAICWQTDWRHVGAALYSLRAEFWLAAFGLLLVSQIVSTLRWRLFARALRFENGLRQMTGYYFIGMFFNLVLPTSVGGDVIRAWYLDGKSERKLAAFASVFLDRLNGLMVLVAMACTAVLFSPLALPAWIPWSVAGIAGSGLLGLAALPLALRSGLLPAHRKRQLQTMLQLLREPKTLLLTTGLSLFVQGASVAIVWLIGAGLHAPIPGVYYWIMVPMVSLLTLLPVSVNGMGVREGGVVLFLAPLGVNQGTALTLSFLWFLVYAAGSLMGGVVYLAGAFPKPETPPADEELLPYGPVAGDSGEGRAGQSAKAA